MVEKNSTIYPLDAYEKVNLMNNTLSTEASEAKLALIVEADRIRS